MDFFKVHFAGQGDDYDYVGVSYAPAWANMETEAWALQPNPPVPSKYVRLDYMKTRAGKTSDYLKSRAGRLDAIPRSLRPETS